MIDDSTEQLAEFSAKKQIKVYWDISPGIMARVDERMFGSVIRNLLSNAIKFTNRGGKIVIKAEQNTLQTNVQVIDNGIGISESNIKTLFKIDSGRGTPGTEGERSSGLGLILCKEFVEKHGETIWVESNIDEGSIFTFTIPSDENLPNEIKTVI